MPDNWGNMFKIQIFFKYSTKIKSCWKEFLDLFAYTLQSLVIGWKSSRPTLRQSEAE